MVVGRGLYLASTLSLLTGDNTGPVVLSIGHISVLKFMGSPLRREEEDGTKLAAKNVKRRCRNACLKKIIKKLKLWMKGKEILEAKIAGETKKKKKKTERGRDEIFSFFFLASAGKVTSGGRGLRALERWRPGANPLSQLPCVPGVQGPAGSKVCAYVGCCKARKKKKTTSVADNDSWHRVR